MRKIKGPSRQRVTIRPRAVHASLTRHYEASVEGELVVNRHALKVTELPQVA